MLLYGMYTGLIQQSGSLLGGELKTCYVEFFKYKNMNMKKKKKKRGSQASVLKAF